MERRITSLILKVNVRIPTEQHLDNSLQTVLTSDAKERVAVLVMRIYWKVLLIGIKKVLELLLSIVTCVGEHVGPHGHGGDV